MQDAKSHSRKAADILRVSAYVVLRVQMFVCCWVGYLGVRDHMYKEAILAILLGAVAAVASEQLRAGGKISDAP
jgi:hypothetical protein